MKNIFWFLVLFALNPFISKTKAQIMDPINVKVYELSGKDTLPIVGANVIWTGTNIGNVTDENGWAVIPCIMDYPHLLSISYVGYPSDTFMVEEESPYILVNLKPSIMLEGVEVKAQREVNFVSSLDPHKTEVIKGGEFKKAACCNLSESFQTNATVDVGYTDAITGAKEIMMLGLDGVYVQTTIENLPLFRGLVQSYGLEYIPAPWMEQISVSKGITSVRNGFEGITGNINVGYKQPFEAEKLHLDVFANHQGRAEAFLTSGQIITDKVANVAFSNLSLNRVKWDGNHDGFIDDPLFTRASFMDRLNFHGEKAEAQFGVKYLYEDRQGGQMDFNPKTDGGTTSAYGFGVKTNRVEVFGKNGYFFKDKPDQSVGLQFSGIWHQSNAFYGLKDYDGTQWNANGAVIFETMIKNNNHKIATGGNFIYDNYQEQYQHLHYNRKEFIPGAFVEYTYKYLDKVTMLLGVRADYHNTYGFQASPRVHFRYAPVENTTFRISAGRGWRVPNVFSENIGLLTSSREFIFDEQPGMEAAWNYGISFLQDFEIAKREGSFGVDFFRTDFTKQVIADVDQVDNLIHIYNLDGRSFSNSLQVELNYELVKGLSFKTAYKMDDVRSDMHGVLLEKHLLARNKGLIALSYKTPDNKWELNLNANIHGKHRLATEHVHDPVSHTDIDVTNYSPIYALLNFQVKKFFKNWEVYLGAENFTNYRQKDPIISADAPFSSTFDAAQVWAPVSGIIGYGGFRFTLN